MPDICSDRGPHALHVETATAARLVVDHVHGLEQGPAHGRVDRVVLALLSLPGIEIGGVELVRLHVLGGQLDGMDAA